MAEELNTDELIDADSVEELGGLDSNNVNHIGGIVIGEQTDYSDDTDLTDATDVTLLDVQIAEAD